MKKLLILLGIIAIVAVIAGCAPQAACGESEFENEAGECCLDEDSNQVCDSEEEIAVEAELDCEDECTANTCSGTELIECKTGSSGCLEKQAKNKVAGECGVECVTSNDCDTGDSCTAENKCEEGVELDCKTGCKLAEIVEQSYLENAYSITIKSIEPVCSIKCTDESTNVKTSDRLNLEPGEEGTLDLANVQTFEYISIVCSQIEAKDCPKKKQVFNPVFR